jgi:hypothetical protein
MSLRLKILTRIVKYIKIRDEIKFSNKGYKREEITYRILTDTNVVSSVKGLQSHQRLAVSIKWSRIA